MFVFLSSILLLVLKYSLSFLLLLVPLVQYMVVRMCVYNSGIEQLKGKSCAIETTNVENNTKFQFMMCVFVVTCPLATVMESRHENKIEYQKRKQNKTNTHTHIQCVDEFQLLFLFQFDVILSFRCRNFIFRFEKIQMNVRKRNEKSVSIQSTKIEIKYILLHNFWFFCRFYFIWHLWHSAKSNNCAQYSTSS